MNNKHTEVQVRYSVLQGGSQEIRELLLTKNQVALVKAIKQLETITTRMLSAIENISVQNASAKLKKLYNAGYIERNEKTAESGGIEFVYYIK